jgi:hypothetical protein
MNDFFSRPAGYFFMLGVSLFAIGLALGNRTVWIIGLCLVAFGLLTGAERPGRG